MDEFFEMVCTNDECSMYHQVQGVLGHHKHPDNPLVSVLYQGTGCKKCGKGMTELDQFPELVKKLEEEYRGKAAALMQRFNTDTPVTHVVKEVNGEWVTVAYEVYRNGEKERIEVEHA